MYHKLNALFDSLGLCQVVEEPTRISAISSTMIDLVAMSLPSALVSCTTTSPLCNSDHLGIHLRLLWRSNQLSKKYSSRVILRYNHADWDKAQDLLDVVDWDSLLLSSDVNQAWLFWKEKFLALGLIVLGYSCKLCVKGIPYTGKPRSLEILLNIEIGL